MGQQQGQNERQGRTEHGLHASTMAATVPGGIAAGRSKLELLHADRDFDPFERLLGLRVVRA